MKFKDEILAEDEAFFMDYITDKKKREELTEKGNDLLSTYNVKTDAMDTIMERAALLWNQLEDEQKANIWKYLKVLIVLAQRV